MRHYDAFLDQTLQSTTTITNATLPIFGGRATAQGFKLARRVPVATMLHKNEVRQMYEIETIKRAR